MELAQQRFTTRSLDGAHTVTSEFKIDLQIIFLILLLLSEVMIYRWFAHWSYGVDWHWLIFLLLPTGLLMFAKSFSMGGKVMHRFSCLTESLGYASIILPLMSLGSIVIPLTPFSVIDPYLKAIDESLGFNVALIMTHLQEHIHWLYRFLWIPYNSIMYQVAFVMIVIPLFTGKYFFAVKRFYKVALVTFIITMIITFFLPSVSACYSYPNYHFEPYLLKEAHDYIAFRANHLHSVGDNVSCPSYHVITALMLIQATWCLKRFYIRYFFVVLNLLMIISTVTTGNHYVTDVIAGVVVYFISFYVIRLWEKRSCKI